MSERDEGGPAQLSRTELLNASRQGFREFLTEAGIDPDTTDMPDEGFFLAGFTWGAEWYAREVLKKMSESNGG